jgi:hypothetical protein
MTLEERAEMERLWQLTQVEKDPNKFTNLVFQLSSLCKRKERRLNSSRLMVGRSAGHKVAAMLCLPHCSPGNFGRTRHNVRRAKAVGARLLFPNEL